MHATPPAASAAPATASAGARAFLAGLIDYAGLFPPARLPLEEALPNFAAYRRSGDAWMLARFIAPASRLPDVRPFSDLFGAERPAPFSVLGGAASTTAAFAEGLRAALIATAAFEAEHAGRVRADLFEGRLPASAAEGRERDVTEALGAAAEALDASAVRFERAFFEAGWGGDWRRTVEQAVAALATRGDVAGVPLGLKLRCGGVTPDLFPTTEQVAFALARCREAGLPFKATAGLHHPVRHADPELGVTRHGFLNVFGGGVLAHALDLDEGAIRHVLDADDPARFALDADGFVVDDLRATPAEVEAARAAFATSYGSCSFNEPREDLRALGML